MPCLGPELLRLKIRIKDRPPGPSRKMTMKILILFLCAVAAAVAAGGDEGPAPEVKPYVSRGPLSGFLKKYLPENEPPVSFADSNRLDTLMRAGNIYLSLQDAIALALENSLDIEYHRYADRRQAETDLMRARAGQLLRFNPSGVLAGFSSASSGAPGAASSLGNLASASSSGGGQTSVLS